MLESTSLCPFGAHNATLPKLAIVMEAQVEDSVSLVRRSADRVCHYCISVLLIEISISCPQYMCINMNIVSMDVIICFYMMVYIC